MLGEIVRIFRKVGTAHMCNVPDYWLIGRVWVWNNQAKRPEAEVPDALARSLVTTQPDMYGLVAQPATRPRRGRKEATP